MEVSISSIVVSIVAGAVSITAAIFAYVQASKARTSARKLDTRAHRISRIDAEVEELRQAYRDFMLAFGTGDKNVAAVNAEILAVSQGATQALSEACRNLARRWTVGDRSIRQINETMDNYKGTGAVQTVSDAYHDAQKQLAEVREKQTTE